MDEVIDSTGREALGQVTVAGLREAVAGSDDPDVLVAFEFSGAMRDDLRSSHIGGPRRHREAGAPSERGRVRGCTSSTL